jgi:hypothetical protein
VRVYVIGKDTRATDIDTGEAARKFLAWLGDDGSPVLTRVIYSWMLDFARSSGLGALADTVGRSPRSVAADVLAWLGDDANPALTKAIHSWMWEPADCGGLGALAETVGDVAQLRAEIIASLRPAMASEPAKASRDSTGQCDDGEEEVTR